MLSREDILSLVDINVKKITVPDHIPGWGGQELYIKQLTRGQQDLFLKRRFGEMTLKRNDRGDNQEINMPSIYGHDALLCSMGICDEKGKAYFSESDVSALNEKSGEAIGWIAVQVLRFSGMSKDIDEKSPDEALEEDLKNS